MGKDECFKSSVSIERGKLYARVCVFKMKQSTQGETSVYLHVDYIADNKRNVCLSFNRKMVKQSLLKAILVDAVALITDQAKSLVVDSGCRVQLANLIKKYSTKKSQ